MSSSSKPKPLPTPQTETDSIPSYSYEKDAESDELPHPSYATESYQSGNTQPNLVLFDSENQNQQQSQSQSYQPPQPQSQPSNPGFNQRTPNAGVRNMPDHASYATSAGWGISNLAAISWFLPPFTSVYVLVVETENDLARFHAYQSGLTGMLFFFLFWFLRSWLGWYSISIILGMAYYGWSWVCAQTAHRAAPTLTRMPYLPYFAEIAERWVGEE